MKRNIQNNFPINVLWLALLLWGFSVSTLLAEETQTLEPQTIEEAGRDYLMQTMEWHPNDAEVSVIYSGRALTLPPGKMKLEFQMSGNRHPVGRVPLSLVVSVDKRIIRKVWLNANVEAFFEVVQASRAVPRDRILTPGDVEVVRVRSSRPLRNIVYDPNKVIGFRAMRDIDLGQTISPYMVKQVPLVKRGDRVLLVVEQGRLRITAPGKVKESGFKDSMVQVENLQTKKTIYGTVVNSKTIKVEF